MAKYRDISGNFDAHPTTGDVSTITDDNAVKAAIKNLIFTNSYERPFEPDIRCGIKNLLFDPISPITSINISRLIKEVIDNFEPRAKIQKVEAIPDYNNYGYLIKVYFSLINKSETQAIEVFLEQVR